jgi:hypothetical protein
MIGAAYKPTTEGHKEFTHSQFVVLSSDLKKIHYGRLTTSMSSFQQKDSILNFYDNCKSVEPWAKSAKGWLVKLILTGKDTY